MAGGGGIMSEHIDQTVAALQQKMHEHESAVVKIKGTINQLLELDGRPALYADETLRVTSATAATTRKDAYYGQPLATCVRAILEHRGALNQGAATSDEIYEALVAGGFDFEEKADGLAKRNMAISLSKNTTTFARTPNGTWGLREWYPSLAVKKSRGGLAGSGTVVGQAPVGSGTGLAAGATAPHSALSVATGVAAGGGGALSMAGVGLAAGPHSAKSAAGDPLLE
jgi:hypothetical protein